jgi:hypothetical protein
MAEMQRFEHFFDTVLAELRAQMQKPPDQVEYSEEFGNEIVRPPWPYNHTGRAK